MTYKEKFIKEIINKSFTWKDVDPKRFSDYDVVKSNVFCPMHEHSYTEGNSKFYYDEEREIYILHCFVEHKNFTVYDYVKKIICEEKQRYSSPLSFLKYNMNEGDIRRLYKLAEENELNVQEDMFQKKKEYIDNVYTETGNVIDYIEELFTA